MHYQIPHRRSLLCSAVALSLLPFSTTLSAQDSQIEEVVVTGSFITRDTVNTTTPIQTMTEQSLIEQGTPNLGEVLRNSTFNYGVESVTNIVAANGQSAGLQGANFKVWASELHLLLSTAAELLTPTSRIYTRKS